VSLSWEYAAGRTSALESTLVSERTWSQIVGAQGYDELLKVLGDTWYGRIIHGDSIEQALNRAVSMAEAELMELDPGIGLAGAILLRRDVRNARYAWKSLASGGEGDVPFEEEGTLPVSLLVRAWNDPAHAGELPGMFRTALEAAQSVQSADSIRIDMILDQLAAEVERVHLAPLDPGLKAFFQTRAELRNFLTAGRLATGSTSAGQLEGFLLPGGFHSTDEITDATRKNRLPEALGETTGLEAPASALKEALDGGSFLPFQRESDRVCLSLLAELAARPFGPGLLFSYVLRREFEALHLNLVTAARKADMNTAKLLARLPR
jgi:hypothetical protein